MVAFETQFCKKNYNYWQKLDVIFRNWHIIVRMLVAHFDINDKLAGLYAEIFFIPFPKDCGNTVQYIKH